MDYLDPKKQSRHRLVLFVGYLFVGVAIVIASLVLLYQAYGFGITRNGTVIQNGLVFISSQPKPADIYLNGQFNKARTNTRLVLPAGLYDVQIKQAGYHSWQRSIDLAGASVLHLDYPFLVPTSLKTSKVQTFSATPSLATQSPDRRWLVVARPDSITSFDIYDLKNPAKLPLAISLPASVVTAATTSQSWQLGEWADDNTHLLLQHLYDGKSEYILVDRTAAEQSVNLSTTLNTTPSKLGLVDKKYDQYYLYDAAAKTITTASLGAPAPAAFLQHVLAFQPYSSDTVLYATDNGVENGRVTIKLLSGGTTYTIRSFAAGSTYLLDLTEYSGVLHVAAGSTADNKVYIYRDPIAQISAGNNRLPTPAQVLHLNQPNYISFSHSAQLIMAENGSQFGTYDLENKRGYNYVAPLQLDGPQTHASWMDGNRIVYVSGAKLVMFDYDQHNQQLLMAASPNYLPFFAPDYSFVQTFALGGAENQLSLTQTSLLVKK